MAQREALVRAGRGGNPRDERWRLEDKTRNLAPWTKVSNVRMHLPGTWGSDHLEGRCHNAVLCSADAEGGADPFPWPRFSGLGLDALSSRVESEDSWHWDLGCVILGSRLVRIRISLELKEKAESLRTEGVPAAVKTMPDVNSSGASTAVNGRVSRPDGPAASKWFRETVRRERAIGGTRYSKDPAA